MFNYKEQDELINKLFALNACDLDWQDFCAAAEGIMSVYLVHFKSSSDFCKEVENSIKEEMNITGDNLDDACEENREYRLADCGFVADVWEYRVNNLESAKNYEIFKRQTIDLLNFDKARKP